MTNEEIILKAKEEIRLRGLSPDTEIEYLTGIRVLARYYDNRPLEELHEPELRAFLLHLIESGRKAGTVNRYNSSFRFVYGAVLERNLNHQMIPRRRIHRELPQIMSRNEIVWFLESIDNLRDRAILRQFMVPAFVCPKRLICGCRTLTARECGCLYVVKSSRSFYLSFFRLVWKK